MMLAPVLPSIVIGRSTDEECRKVRIRRSITAIIVIAIASLIFSGAVTASASNAQVACPHP
jgi:hypothetical protein